MEITCYHATDRVCAENIMNNRFIMKTNPKHWLGNGIYFFLDKKIAEWWSTGPCEHFGVKMTNPVIIKVKMDIPDENVLDLRNSEEYGNMSQALKSYYEILFNENKSKEIADKVCWNVIQSAFFNNYREEITKGVIIANFCSDLQPYTENFEQTILKYINLRHVETQICIRDDMQKYITYKEIL